MTYSHINPNAGYAYKRDWQTMVRELREANKQFAECEGIMTPYERQSIYGGIQAQKQRDHGAILAGATAHLNAFVDYFKQTREVLQKAKQREIMSWDSSRLTSEMTSFKMRLDQALTPDSSGIFTGGNKVFQVAELYQEAKASGDKYRMRAAAEVIHGLDTSSVPRDNVADLLLVIGEAGRDLQELRTTEEIRTAGQEAEKAAKELFEEKEAIREIAENVLGESLNDISGGAGSAFGRLLRTVQVDWKAGEIKLYNPDDPEVTGIVWEEKP